MTAKRFVVEALVPVALTKVKFWKLDWPETPVEVAVMIPKVASCPNRFEAKKLVDVA